MASSCEANLGSKLSEGTDNIGNNAKEIYPKIHNGAWRRADDSVAVLVGRNYYGVKGAEIEGKIVCLGDFEIRGGGPADLVEVGVVSIICWVFKGLLSLPRGVSLKVYCYFSHLLKNAGFSSCSQRWGRDSRWKRPQDQEKSSSDGAWR